MYQKVKIDLDLFDWLVCCIDWRIRDLEDLDFGEIGDFGQGIVWRDWGFWRNRRFWPGDSMEGLGILENWRIGDFGEYRR